MRKAAQSLCFPKYKNKDAGSAGESTRMAPVHASLCGGGLSPLSNLDSFKGQLFSHMDSDGQGLSQQEPSNGLK